MAAYLNQNYYGNESYGVAAAAQGLLRQRPQGPDARAGGDPRGPPEVARRPTTSCRTPNIECLDPGAETPDAETCNEVAARRPGRRADRPAPQPGARPDGAGPHAADRGHAHGRRLRRGRAASRWSSPPQQSSQWQAPQFVWQVRKELTTQLCGADAETCDQTRGAAGSTITTTLDMRLQDIAEKWVKAATVVPNSKNPRATAKALGLKYEPLDGQPAQQGPPQRRARSRWTTRPATSSRTSARRTRTRRKATKKFQPRFDVLADGWRQPGSAFKPVVYSHRHREQEHHGGVDVHGRRDQLRRRLHARPTRTTSSAGPSGCATPSASRSTSRP